MLHIQFLEAFIVRNKLNTLRVSRDSWVKYKFNFNWRCPPRRRRRYLNSPTTFRYGCRYQDQATQTKHVIRCFLIEFLVNFISYSGCANIAGLFLRTKSDNKEQALKYHFRFCWACSFVCLLLCAFDKGKYFFEFLSVHGINMFSFR